MTVGQRKDPVDLDEVPELIYSHLIRLAPSGDDVS